MSGLAIFDRITANRWAEVERWRSDQEFESVHLDFKIRGATTPTFDNKELSKISEAMSAFANVEGGVLAYGVKTQRASGQEQDQVSGLAAFPDFHTCAGNLEHRLPQLTDPPIPGSRVVQLEDPTRAGYGIVVLYVPQTDTGPHQGSYGDAAGRYYLRTASNISRAPHSIIADMFGRRPRPRLRIALNQDSSGYVHMFVVNNGRGTAEQIFVRITAVNQQGSDLGTSAASWPDNWTRRNQAAFHGAVVHSLSTQFRGIVFPGDVERFYSSGFTMPGGGEVTIKARIDARGIQPVLFDTTVTLYGGNDLVLAKAVGDP
jgi:hypothetical protein